jgi:epoxyqueuosine reductase
MKPLLNLTLEDLQAFGISEWGYTEELQARSFDQFKNWIQNNHESLPYLGTQLSIYNRESIKLWWDEAQSCVVFLFEYTAAKKSLLETNHHKVASYTLGFEGEDYHDVLARRLHEIAKMLNLQNYKITLDTQPILERDLAYRAGLGWFGKNSFLIHPKKGSYFIIAGLILDHQLSLDLRATETDHCGTCMACVEACPTNAIDAQSRSIIASKCISTWTIEDRKLETAPIVGLEKSRGEIFGCDICQDVCPWNSKPLKNAISFLSEKAIFWRDWYHRPISEILLNVQSMSGKALQRFMLHTPFSRPGKKTLIRVLSFWKSNDQSSE